MMTIPENENDILMVSLSKRRQSTLHVEEGAVRTVGVGIVEEDLDDVDVGGAGEGVTADTDAEALTESDVSGLGDGFVRQRSGT